MRPFVFSLLCFILASAFSTLTLSAMPLQKPTKTQCLERIHSIVSKYKASVGVAVIQPDTRDTLVINGNKHFPMQSVFKFHIALNILHSIDQKKYRLTDSIRLRKADLDNDLWSPLREKYGRTGITLTLDEILRPTVAQSDNVGCDVLLHKLGGPKALQTYLHKNGIRDIAVAINEATMQAHWARQYENWSTPLASAQALLATFHAKTLLSKESTEYLWNVMAGTTTGANKLKALLPAGTTVAHKTGWSGAKNGLTAASNDIGMIVLPNQQRVAIAVFVGESYENEDTNCLIIAEIGKAVWDYYTAQ